MILYTREPLSSIFPEEPAATRVQSLPHGYAELTHGEEGPRLQRIFSTDPKDYLNTLYDRILQCRFFDRLIIYENSSAADANPLIGRGRNADFHIGICDLLPLWDFRYIRLSGS